MPGIPKMCVISFHGSFHGRTIGCLSVTHSKPIHLVDIPLMGWSVITDGKINVKAKFFDSRPVCNYPRYKYPLNDNVEYNKKQDEDCLAEVEETIEKQIKAGT